MGDSVNLAVQLITPKHGTSLAHIVSNKESDQNIA